MYDATPYYGLIKVKIYDPKLRSVSKGNFGEGNPLATLVINPSQLEDVLGSLHNSGHKADGAGLVDLLKSDMFPFSPNDNIEIGLPTGIAAASWMYSATPGSKGFKPNSFIGYGDTVVEAIASLCDKLDIYQIERIDSIA